MKPTPDQCKLAIEIGAALIHEGGSAATMLIKAGQVGSPVLDSRLNTLLRQVGIIPPNVATMVTGFYQDAEDDRRGVSIRIRLSEAEKAKLEELAAAAGETQSEYVRRMCRLTEEAK